jgi:hypothetical protein
MVFNTKRLNFSYDERIISCVKITKNESITATINIVVLPACQPQWSRIQSISSILGDLMVEENSKEFSVMAATSVQELSKEGGIDRNVVLKKLHDYSQSTSFQHFSA